MGSCSRVTAETPTLPPTHGQPLQPKTPRLAHQPHSYIAFAHIQTTHNTVTMYTPVMMVCWCGWPGRPLQAPHPPLPHSPHQLLGTGSSCMAEGAQPWPGCAGKAPTSRHAPVPTTGSQGPLLVQPTPTTLQHSPACWLAATAAAGPPGEPARQGCGCTATCRPFTCWGAAGLAAQA